MLTPDPRLAALRAAAVAASRLPWEWATSNSFRRIPGVMEPRCHQDGQPDIAIAERDMEFIAAANPAVVLSLLDALGSAEGRLAAAEGAAASYSVRCPECDGAGGFMVRNGPPEDEDGELVPCRLCEASGLLHDDDVQGLAKSMWEWQQRATKAERERDEARWAKGIVDGVAVDSVKALQAITADRDALAARLAGLERVREAGDGMKLWLLRPMDGLPDGDNPWEPWFDKTFGFVVRAETEAEARSLAHGKAGDENRGVFLGGKISYTTTPWLDEKYSTCVELTTDGLTEVVIEDNHAA